MSQARIIAIVPARMGSTRLANKVLAPVGERPMLERVIERLGRMHTLDGFIVATSVEKQDDAVAELCADHRWNCFRGPERDVLERTLRAAQAMGASDIVSVAADSPLFSWQEADRLVALHVASGNDLTHNQAIWGGGLPAGAGVEVLTMDALGMAWTYGIEPRHREQVCEYLHERPERFRLGTLRAPPELDRPRYRLTVDTAADLRLVQRIQKLAAAGDDVVDLSAAVALLDEDPQLAACNAQSTRRAG
ncbi:MAG: NTP transferase domain-containing protein [Planctomycetes bacterium]|jgi:spore coat polysaccharide biosynthesis protein SpsF|nr:NTP transferase domain-containing protein [Planctomycetota bacterium]